MRPTYVSFACYYIQFYPYWPFKNPPRRTPRPSKLSSKLKSFFPLLLYYYTCRSWAVWAILYPISLHPPILNLLNGLSFPEPHEDPRYTHFLLYFNARFTCWRRLDRSFTTTAVLVCNWQHLLVITIVIIIPINKMINHHNHCIRCQSFVQSSTHDVASQDSSYIFLEKGNKTTKKKTVKVLTE